MYEILLIVSFYYKICYLKKLMIDKIDEIFENLIEEILLECVCKDFLSL